MSDPVQLHWDNMYALPMSQIPWEISEPPVELAEYVKNKSFSGMSALDIGCGTGNYTAFLARQGFDEVIGVDFSGKAIDIAKKVNASYKNIGFINGDVTKLQSLLDGKKFDFILDYSILHHIEQALLEGYASQFAHLLNTGGELLLVCYSENDEHAHGSNSAQGKFGNTMYYRTAKEIKKQYEELRLEEYKKAKLGKRQHHEGHYFLFKK